MCKFDQKYLLEMEDRINTRIDEVFNKASSQVINPATVTAINGLKKEFLDEIKKITEKLDDIYPHVISEMEHKKAYALVKGDIAKGSGFMKWVLLTVVTFGALSGYLQTFLKWFLHIK